MDENSTGPIRCLRCEDYTVGWISALPVELGAARKMFDNEHYPLAQDPNDSVVYTYGSIGFHNVVMACMPAGQVGNNSAATIATGMRLKFPYLRFGLLVGIAGGVPTARDIRLGDVVVSQPNAGHGGVVQHDFGKNTVTGFERTSFLNSPPDILLSALSTYQACNLDMKGNPTSHYFKPKKFFKEFSEYPAPDMLFQADYEHVNEGGDCANCDPRKLYKPIDRSQRAVMVHYGTVASGNQVIKNGVVREKISKELGDILCYEMEAAGVMSTLRCLVVRGICDYSDSHKNKDWQPYAALTAATYAKELLSFVPAVKSQEVQQHSGPMMNSMVSRTTKASKRKPTIEQWQSSRGELSEYGFKTQYISGYDAPRVHSTLMRLRCPETTQWILGHEDYQTWRGRDGATLWLTGKIGSGKTLVTSTIIEHLLDTKEEKELVLHFFYRHSHKNELSVSSMLNSCIKQTLDYLESANRFPSQDIQSRLKSQYGMHKPTYDFVEVVEDIFEPLLSSIDKVTLVIDGLDECETNEILKILKLARMFIKKSGRSVLISGRESLDVVHSIPGALKIQVSENTTDDISVFIRWKIEEKMLDRRIIEDPIVRAEIEAALSDKTEQMILWVSLQIENIWADCANDSDIRKALENLPKDLTETYDRCLRRIFSKEGIFASGYAFKALLWILESDCPLSLTQLRQALAIDLVRGTLDYDKIPSVQDTVRSCANLVVQNIEGHILLAHHSVYQYLKDRIHLGKLQETLRPSLTLPESPLSGLAMLCVSHLTSAHYSLAIQPALQSQMLRLEPPVISRLTEIVPWYIRSFLPRPKPVQIKLPSTKTAGADVAELPEFFHFAREQWPGLTRVLVGASKGWVVDTSEREKFLDLVLQPNLTWRLHPWDPLGQSIDSHYFGLLGWAIVHQHKPMLKALLMLVPTKLRADFYTTPFHQYGGLSAVFLAARSDEPWIFETIQQEVVRNNLANHLWISDSQGWSVMYHAVDSRSMRLITPLGHLYRSSSLHIDILTPLKLAVAKGYNDIAGKILQTLDGNNEYLHLTAINAAIRHGNSSLLAEQLIIYKQDPYGIGSIEKAALDAARAGHVSVIDQILQVVPELFPISWRKSILLAAIDANQSVTVACVLANKENLSKDVLIQSITLASQQKDLTIMVQILGELYEDSIEVPSRRNLSLSMSKGCETVLHQAVKSGHTQAVRILLDHGIDPDCIVGNTRPLEEAVQLGNEEIASLLLKYEALPYSKYLKTTVEKDYLKMAKLLLENGGPSVYSSMRQTLALYHAVEVGTLAMLKLLFSYTFDKNPRDSSQRTLLMYAAMEGHPEKVEWLCTQSSSSKSKEVKDIDLLDDLGQTALFHACIAGNFDSARILLNYGANSSIPNSKGQTILHAAAISSSQFPTKLVQFFEELINKGDIDINAQDYLDRTALDIARQNRHRNLISLLYQKSSSSPSRVGI